MGLGSGDGPPRAQRTGPAHSIPSNLRKRLRVEHSETSAGRTEKKSWAV